MERRPTADDIPSGEPAERLARVAGIARGVIAGVRRVALASMLSALVLWLIVAAPWPGSGTLRVALSATLLALLLVPAAGTALALVMLNELVRFSQQIRDLRGGPGGGLPPAVGGQSKLRRVPGALLMLWKLRASSRSGAGSWLRALGPGRLMTLTSLPALSWMLVSFLLSFPLILAALVASLWWTSMVFSGN